MAYRFGKFYLDAERLELWKDRTRIKLQNKPLSLLVYLVRHRGRIVSKEDLARDVWDVRPGEAFGDCVIPTTIATLRLALGDRKKETIKTFNNRGYQFSAAVVEVPSASRSEDQLFVGYVDQWTRLSEALARAVHGEGSFHLIEGEHGIGKTHVTEQLANIAASQGAGVFSSCLSTYDRPAGLTSWARAFVSHVRRSQNDKLRELMPLPEADAIAPLVPELYEVFAELSQSQAEAPLPGPESDQRLQATVASLTLFIRRMADYQPLLLIFDDLQDADDSLCRLLLASAREVHRYRILLVGTYRGVALGSRHPMVVTLGQLDRGSLIKRHRLSGFSVADVESYIVVRTGVSGTELAAAVHERTGGNPLFVAKVVSHAVDRGILDRPDEVVRELPVSVCEAVAYQLSRLSSACYEILAQASIFGCEFGVEVVTRPGESHENVAARLEEATSAQILARVSGIGRYRFRHRLVWEVLYESFDLLDRAHRHADALAFLENHHGRQVDEHSSELFHHALKGVLAGTAEKAIEYGSRASKRAIQECAHEEAIRHCEQLLQVIQLRTPRNDALYCEVVIRLGNALAQLGRIESAKQEFRRAAALARTANLPELQARAALDFGMAEEPVGVPASTELIDLLTEALERLADGPLRVRVLCRLAVGLCWSEAGERAIELSSAAVALARRLADRLGLGLALLTSRETEWTYDNAPFRLRLDDEVITLARTIPHRELLLLGLSARIADRMELNGLAGVESDMRELEREAERLQRPRYLWVVRALRTIQAWCDGRLDEAERLRVETDDYGQQAHQPLVAQVVSIQTWRLLTERGRLHEVRASIEAYVREYPGLLGWRCVLGHVYAELELLAEARDLLHEIARNGWALAPQDRFRVSALSSAAELCAFVGDAARAKELYELIVPYENRYVVVGYHAAFLGSPAYYLGRLASTMGRWPDARRHFERALEENKRVKPMLVRALFEYAAMLHRLGRERRKGRTLCKRGLELASQIGMVSMKRKLEVLLRDLERNDAA